MQEAATHVTSSRFRFTGLAALWLTATAGFGQQPPDGPQPEGGASGVFSMDLDALSNTKVTTRSRGSHPDILPGSRSLHILLAEDNAVNEKVACAILKKAGHTVEVARDGRQAVRLMAAGSFDVVLMDVQMPEMDGFEATAAIREMEKGTGAHTPVIAMTAHAMGGYKERCLEAGMDGYVTKPIRREVLLQALAEFQGAPEPSAVAGSGMAER